MLAAEKAEALLLVKPQFEVGRDGIGKGGIVSDQDLLNGSVDAVAKWLDGLVGWSVNGIKPSPIKGGDGNQEFLLWGTRR